MSKTVLFQSVQFSISTLLSSIWPINRTLSAVTIPGESRPGSDGNKGLLRIPPSSSITGAFTRLGRLYFSAKTQPTGPLSYIRPFIHTYIHTYIHTNLYIYIYIYRLIDPLNKNILDTLLTFWVLTSTPESIYIYIYIYIYRERERDREWERDVKASEVSWISSREMDTLTWVQIVVEVVAFHIDRLPLGKAYYFFPTIYR